MGQKSKSKWSGSLSVLSYYFFPALRQCSPFSYTYFKINGIVSWILFDFNIGPLSVGLAFRGFFHSVVDPKLEIIKSRSESRFLWLKIGKNVQLKKLFSCKSSLKDF